MLLFSGSSNQPLAEKVAEELKVTLSSSETVRFADGEVRVRLLTEVKNEHIAVVQSLSYPQDSNLMELCQFADAAKRNGAKKIIAVIPYLAYSRQHKARRSGEAVSVSLVAKFLKAAGFTEAILLEVHDEEVLNFFTIPAINLSAAEVFASYIDSHRDDFGGDDLIIVAPDKGRRTQAQSLADILEVNWTVTEKVRSLETTDKIEKSKLDVKLDGKEVIIFDDVVSTGSTVLESAKNCLGNGASHVYLLVTHGIFSHGDALFWQNSPFEKIYISDSILVPKTKIFAKLEIISVAPLLAKNLVNFI